MTTTRSRPPMRAPLTFRVCEECGATKTTREELPPCDDCGGIMVQVPEDEL